MTTVQEERLVGPVMQAGDMADAVEAAIRADNPEAEVVIVDRGSYIRIHTADRCVITRETMSDVLGRPFEMHEIEPDLAFFSGRIKTSSSEIVFDLHTEN